MTLSLREARPSDLAEYSDMMQQTYEAAYVDERIGLTKDCFSKEVFATNDTQRYLASKLASTDLQHTWLVVEDNKIVGAATIEDKGNECEMTGFYVLPDHQGRGIGKQLWLKILEFSGTKDIVLDIYTHNKPTISLYERWGFQEDTTKPHFYRHWPEWPDGLRAECMYMRRPGGLS